MERSPAAVRPAPMSASSEAKKRTLSPPPIGDSPTGPTLPKRAPAAMSNEDGIFCQVCQSYISDQQPQFQSIVALPNRPTWLCLICDMCRQKASNFDAVQLKLDQTNQKLADLRVEMAAQSAEMKGRLSALENKSRSSTDLQEISKVVMETVTHMMPKLLAQIVDHKFDCLEKKIEEKETIRKNARCLVVAGLPEEDDESTITLTENLNSNLLPALKVPDRFTVAHSYRMGKKPDDGTPRLCKLVFDSDIARDATKSGVYHLKNIPAFKKVRIRPSLTPSQQTLKKNLEGWRNKQYPDGFKSGMRPPVGIRFEGDGSPYLWNFSTKSRIEISASFSASFSGAQFSSDF